MTVVVSARVPETEDVLAITEDVWTALLGDDATLVPRDVPPRSSFDADAWSAATTISGGWQGVVTIELGEAAARRLTTRMLALAADGEATDSDVADAVGELVNMVGGNVKGLLPGPSTLSLPAVAAGRAAFSRDTVLACRVDLAWQDGPVRVSVHVPQEGPR
jgi:chemotaxis protein CheX